MPPIAYNVLDRYNPAASNYMANAEQSGRVILPNQIIGSTAPLISNFTRAQHDHSSASQGGPLNGFTALAAASVKSAQMLNGMVKGRQGGTSGDASWLDEGTSNTDTSAKDVFIQVGSRVEQAGTDTVVTFPVPYTELPIVVACTSSASGFNTFCIVVGTTLTGFSFRVLDPGSAHRAERISWIAIGQ